MEKSKREISIQLISKTLQKNKSDKSFNFNLL